MSMAELRATRRGISSHNNDRFLTDTTKQENVAPSPPAVKCRTAAPGCPWAGEGAYPTLSYKRAIKRLFFVILSAAKNLSFKAAEILHSAALRSE